MSRISLIVCTRDAGAELELTLASVRAQTHTDLELIVVPGVPLGPIDGATVLYVPPRGVYDALNHGIAAARGDVVGLLHGGDTFASYDVLSRLSALFDADSALDYVYGDIQYVSGAGRRRGRIYRGRYLSLGALSCGIAPPHPSLFMRRALACGLGAYDVSEPVAADFDMWIRIAAYPRAVGRYSGILTTDMAVGGMSTSLGARLAGNNRARLRILRKHNMQPSFIRLIIRYLPPPIFGAIFYSDK